MGQHLISEGDLTYTVELTSTAGERWRGASWAVDVDHAAGRVFAAHPACPACDAPWDVFADVPARVDRLGSVLISVYCPRRAAAIDDGQPAPHDETDLDLHINGAGIEPSPWELCGCTAPVDPVWGAPSVLVDRERVERLIPVTDMLYARIGERGRVLHRHNCPLVDQADEAAAPAVATAENGDEVVDDAKRPWWMTSLIAFGFAHTWPDPFCSTCAPEIEGIRR